jgi:muramoyltetrapeptide carboxypeptidase LdcA involved in peptidoglycan recycling
VPHLIRGQLALALLVAGFTVEVRHRNKLMNLEDLSEEELEKLKGTFAHLAASKTVRPEKAQLP